MILRADFERLSEVTPDTPDVVEAIADKLTPRETARIGLMFCRAAARRHGGNLLPLTEERSQRMLERLLAGIQYEGITLNPKQADYVLASLENELVRYLSGFAVEAIDEESEE